MAYENLGDGSLDYLPCRYGKSKLLFRGPKRRIVGPYTAMIGGTETYGKFVETPFATQVEEAAGMPVLNLGYVNAGVDVFINDKTVLDMCSAAEVTVIQIAGAQNMSNRFYAVHPRRNDRFLRASSLLQTIYREVDFTEFNFTRHLLQALYEVSEDKFELVEQELKEAWTARMKSLIASIDSKVVLLWMADHAPEDAIGAPTFDHDPLFVDRAMLNALRPFVSDYVEVVVSSKEIEVGQEGLVFAEMEAPAASGALGVVAQERAAQALTPVLDKLIG